jgi:outer membrane protein TolC
LRRVCAASLLAGSLLAGCAGGLESIDRKTDELIAKRSASLLGATVKPEWVGRLGNGTPTFSEALPATTDPAATDLPFKPADEARDAASRLASHQTIDPSTPGLVNLDLDGALRQTQLTNRAYLRAQEDYLLAAINLLRERNLWGPKFFASTSAIATATGTDGDFQAPLAIINDLRVTQRLPSGGELEARALWSATEQLRDVATDRYTQAGSLIFSGNIPLLRGAGIAAREELVSAERELVYAARSFEQTRRQLLADISRTYFDLLQQSRAIENQQRALDLLKRLETRTAALVEAGRQAEFQKNIAASDVLRATSRLVSQREQFVLALDRFKVQLGLPVETPVLIVGEPPRLPEPDTTPQEAAEIALQYRLDLQTSRDQVDDALRAVSIAQNDTLADVDLIGSATFRTKPGVREGGLVTETDDAIYSGGVRVDWPLDRERERLNVRASQIRAEQARRTLEQTRDTVILEARAAVREIERARFDLTLQEEAVRINQRRAKEQEIKADEVTAQDIVDTANALRDAENARDAAFTDLLNAVLNYLVVTGQMRVGPAGELQLPGK